MTTVTRRVNGRPAHTRGPTSLAYTTDGKYLITAGSNTTIRVFTVGSNAEPRNIDGVPEDSLAVSATNDRFVVGAEEGTVILYSLTTFKYEKLLFQTPALPVRDVAFSPDGQWVAVASDDLVVRVIKVDDVTQTMTLREQTRGNKHVTWDPSGSKLAVSCCDGSVYVYKMTSEEPELLEKLSGVVRALEPDREATSIAAWCRDSRALAAVTSSNEIEIWDTSDWKKQRVFKDGHRGDITAIAWSANGALLASAGTDNQIVLWDSRTQSKLASYDYTGVVNLVWHPTKNHFSFGSSEGLIYIYEDFVPADHAELLSKPLQPAPMLRDPLQETNGNARQIGANDGRHKLTRAGDPMHAPFELPFQADETERLSDFLGEEDDEDFVVDDENGDYSEPNINGKRSHLDGDGRVPKKHQANGYASAYPSIWKPKGHPAFQPSSTPWTGNRRYLSLTLIGCIWTVDQDTHHTVTVEFYDRDFARDFHFTDPWRYDKACLNEVGCAFSCPSGSRASERAHILYRPHDSWTQRGDWKIELPEGEEVVTLCLSSKYITVSTSAGWVRVFTLFGVPVRVYRSSLGGPAVTSASWRDYVLIVGNGPVGFDGRPQLTFSIENVRRDEVLQRQEILPLPNSTTELTSVLWSEEGDPYIYDSEGVLLVGQHWRTMGQCRWVPVLETRRMERVREGRREETYWPVAVAGEKFHCIILKGGDRYPYFPRPLLSEFDFCITLYQPGGGLEADEERDKELTDGQKLEQEYMLRTVLCGLEEDRVEATQATSAEKVELARREVDIDKVLLQMLATECLGGEERGMKALEIVGLLRNSDGSGRMLDAATKVAERYEMGPLGDKIRQLREDTDWTMAD